MTIIDLILKSDYTSLDEKGKEVFNAALIIKYPWIKKGVPEEMCDLSFNVFDALPEGWIKCFLIDICEDIDAAYNELSDEQKEEFSIAELKEKWGRMIIDCYPFTDSFAEISDKYYELSSKVCQVCGAPATKRHPGWIAFLCDEHANKNCVPIE